MTTLATAAALRDLPPLLRDERALTVALGTPSARLAITEVARPISIAALAHLSDRTPLIVACPTGTDAARLHDDLVHFLGRDECLLFPAWETLPFERVSPAVETMGRRMEVLWRLTSADHQPRVIVAGVRALLQRLGPGARTISAIHVSAGRRIDADALTEQLSISGYRREELVEHRGEYARRGAIIDIFPSTADAPIRIDLWGDDVDRLTQFSVNDQRSIADLDEVRIFPAREVTPDEHVKERAARLIATESWGREHWERLAEGAHFDGMESWLPWLTNDDLLLTDLVDERGKVCLVEPRRMRDRAHDLLAEEADLAAALAGTWARDPDLQFPHLHAEPDRLLASASSFWSIDATPEGPETPFVESTGWGPIIGDGSGHVSRVRELLTAGERVIIAADGTGSAERLRSLMLDHEIEFTIASEKTDLTAPGAYIAVAPLHRGFHLPRARLSVLAEADLTGRRRSRRRARPRQGTAGFDDLKPGSYVVHVHHGVGRYEGMVTRAIGGAERDYLLVAYRGEDRLYIPSDQIHVLRPYSGGEAPSLHRLGGSDFASAKSRVRSAVQEIAQELVVLYQQRVNTPGHSFAPDTPWQSEMEDAFGFVETPDQRTAIADVKADMEREIPMDRLICGDVGFGKTEVAIRAAFKAIQGGKQVAVLAPTTLLATQHGTTFSDRFAGFPVRVEVLSRFLTDKQAASVIADLTSGDVDCVIGTHRLLSSQVAFKDLGLLVIDEEQRFGVQHKELIKSLATDVDVLTMSATPIPRTLEMSLVGIRDLSLLQTPPADRQPILTHIGEYDERVAVEAIRRELLREGQVFWVHNRVKSIEQSAARLRELVPEARIAIAHGRMDEATLEQVVIDFWEGRYDVLVCTTIIESGIDMPTVNTLVVERSDLLGLGQLHQLRGRVGRSGQRAYAYLFHPQDRTLSEEAYERLRTIGESTELGSGFRIAMRDLEIRGAGNLLGAAQSGHIAAVGYDLYCQMVTEAVAEMRGETPEPVVELNLDVPADAFLPSDYISREDLRLEAYRRIAAASSFSEVDDISSEWTDRYGPIPEPAAALLVVARLRIECMRLGITDLSVTGSQSAGRTAKLSPIDLKASESMRLRRLSRQAMHKESQRQLVIPIPRGSMPSEFLLGFLNELIPLAAPSSSSDE